MKPNITKVALNDTQKPEPGQKYYMRNTYVMHSCSQTNHLWLKTWFQKQRILVKIADRLEAGGYLEGKLRTSNATVNSFCENFAR